MNFQNWNLKWKIILNKVDWDIEIHKWKKLKMFTIELQKYQRKQKSY
jgi:hypothetical protein